MSVMNGPSTGSDQLIIDHRNRVMIIVLPANSDACGFAQDYYNRLIYHSRAYSPLRNSLDLYHWDEKKGMYMHNPLHGASIIVMQRVMPCSRNRLVSVQYNKSISRTEDNVPYTRQKSSETKRGLAFLIVCSVML